METQTPTPLFPPFLNKGSRDKKDKGPVRRLQEALAVLLPGTAKRIGLVVDGDYGEITATLVTAAQDLVNPILKDNEAGYINTDGDFGPATRRALGNYVDEWPLDDCHQIPFVEGGECLYVGPDSTEAEVGCINAENK